MQVTEVRLKKSDSTDSCKAYGSITLDGDFVVCGIRVLERKDDGQLFVGFPSRENHAGFIGIRKAGIAVGTVLYGRSFF